MKTLKIGTLFFLAVLLLFPCAYADKGVTSAVKKLADTSWMKRKLKKNGFVLAACATNALRMSLEADRFNGDALPDDYHARESALVLGYIATGYLLYAVIDDDAWTWKDKTALVSGTLSLMRESGEIVYQGRRYGWRECLNNRPERHKNEIMWISSKPSFPYIKDDMISTGELTTPLAHYLFTRIGTGLVGGVK